MDILLILLPMLGVMLLMPLFFWLLKRLQHRNFALGAEQTRFDAGIGSFYGLAFKTAGVGLLAIALVVALVMGGGFLMGAFEGGAPEGTMVLTVILVMLSYLLVFALAGGFWVARLQDLVWNRTASAHIGFTSRLPARALTRLWFKNTLLVLVTLGLYFPFAQVASARLRLQAVTVGLAMDPDDLAASAGRHDEAAAGDAAGDLLGFDIGL